MHICLMIGLVILMSAVSAKAQTQYRVHIPFDFNIGQKSYKSGDYSVGLLSPVAEWKLIVFRDARGRNSYTVKPTGSEADSRINGAQIIFNRYAGQYFLAEISAPAFKAELQKTKIEMEFAKNQKALRETVSLAKKN